jgi:hypothetical protein
MGNKRKQLYGKKNYDRCRREWFQVWPPDKLLALGCLPLRQLRLQHRPNSLIIDCSADLQGKVTRG